MHCVYFDRLLQSGVEANPNMSHEPVAVPESEEFQIRELNRMLQLGTPALVAAGFGLSEVTMTGAADSAGVGAGIVVSTTANAVAPIARTVTPTGARRGSRPAG